MGPTLARAAGACFYFAQKALREPNPSTRSRRTRVMSVSRQVDKLSEKPVRPLARAKACRIAFPDTRWQWRAGGPDIGFELFCIQATQGIAVDAIFAQTKLDR